MKRVRPGGSDTLGALLITVMFLKIKQKYLDQGKTYCTVYFKLFKPPEKKISY